MTQHSSSTSIQADDQKTSQVDKSIPWWIYVIVMLGALLTLTGAVISKVNPAMLTNGPITDPARVYTDYLFSRNLALTLMLLLLLAIKARRTLAMLMIVVALIQVFDMINDLLRGDFLLAPGLLVFAIVFLLGAWKLLGQALWRVEVWRS